MKEWPQSNNDFRAKHVLYFVQVLFVSAFKLKKTRRTVCDMYILKLEI